MSPVARAWDSSPGAACARDLSPSLAACRHCASLRAEIDELTTASRRDRMQIRELEEALAEAIAVDEAREAQRLDDLARISKVEKQITNAMEHRHGAAEDANRLAAAVAARDENAAEVTRLRAELQAEGERGTERVEMLQQRVWDLERQLAGVMEELDRTTEDHRRISARVRDLRVELEQVPVLQARLRDAERALRESRAQRDNTADSEAEQRELLQSRMSELDRQLANATRQIQEFVTDKARPGEEKVSMVGDGVERWRRSSSRSSGDGPSRWREPLSQHLDDSATTAASAVEDDLPEPYNSFFAKIQELGWAAVPFRWSHDFTLLHWAAQENRPGLCERLIKLRADPNDVDDVGCSAFTYAKDSGASEALAALERASAMR
eukprot:CAMPEP_0176054866 /NCGR_PEP_ID=MMETSP0120_2-20121206/27305_1 /TAXON_ID=160619 /ORGANISM="Kryptoperidinium foliaceum, Strain CCMP 1326" /LENGTH=381 /DNA_ID=CAMNT_0017388343 /DNA_START=35 /DNA_END=1176 /DNA_ORIENTATION=+